MNGTEEETVALLARLPVGAVLGLAVLFLALWLWLWRKGKPSSAAGNIARAGRIALRGGAGAVALWFCLQSLSYVVSLLTPWPLFLLGLMGAFGIESLWGLYRLEREAVKPRIGKAILALRMAALVVVLLILTQPVLERIQLQNRERQVAILVDRSGSMELADPQRDVEEWLDLLIFHGVVKSKPDAVPESLEQLRAGLNAEQRAAFDGLRGETRLQTAERILGDMEEETKGLLTAIRKKYGVRLIDFAATPRTREALGEGGEEETEDWRRLTDLTSALEEPLEQMEFGRLSGVVVLSDWRDTARGNPEAAVLQLAGRGVPVYPVLLGSRHDRMDLSLTRLDAPESIYLGEGLTAEANVKLSGVPGREIQVEFLRGGEVLEEQTVKVPAGVQTHRALLEFRDAPETQGIHTYVVRIAETPGEEVTENNRWEFQTAVSEDRTNVLLVDRRPNWEFRYLRNLFYGRDKSVHLQYVLSESDTVDLTPGQETPSPEQIVASATRTFGEAEATHLPVRREEWRKFDVIILGDVSPSVLTDSQIAHIEHCVRERGAALVVYSGPEYMPHTFEDPLLRRMLPVEYRVTPGPLFDSPEEAYRLQLTPEGRGHSIMQLAPSVSESLQIWDHLPDLYWRVPVRGIKPGATVLAYAEPVGDDDGGPVTLDGSTEEVSRLIHRQVESHKLNSLVVVQQYGLGRVLHLNFNRTWRLRYRVGDTYHHRFWGQVMTWGAGENLRAGGTFVRLGTDRMTYGTDETVNVVARVLQPDYTPVTDGQIKLEIYRKGRRISVQTLRYRPQSQGLYDAEIGPFPEPGAFHIRLAGDSVDRILLEENQNTVETEFRVATAFNPVELAEFSADAETAGRIADASGVRVFTAADAAAIPEALDTGEEPEPERIEISLWDHGLVLLLLFTLFTSEWLLRRKGGLP